MVCAQDTARTSWLNKDKIRSLEEGWKIKKEFIPDTHKAEKYELFKAL